MYPYEKDSTILAAAMEELSANGFEGMGKVIEILLNEAMKIERARYLQADPFERTDTRRGYANGYKDKQVNTRLGQLSLQVPQVRGLADGDSFYPSSLEKGLRSERALKLAVAEMYVKGVSTRKVADITQKLCGLEVTSGEVSRAAKLLDEELELWRNRPIGEIPYLILDARYEKVRHGGSVIDVAVLVASGVLPTGKRSVLGVSVSLSEAEVHWREFLGSLQERGMHGVRLITSDDHAGLNAARRAQMPSIPWQRCQCHLQRNAQAYVPKVAMREEVAQDIRNIFNASKKSDALLKLNELLDKYEKSAPKLCEWAEENIIEGLTVFDLPSKHRKRLRTTNGVERLNREIKRRTRVATLFPNTDSLLRLVTAVVAEISDDWETNKVYINLKDT